MYSSMIYMSAVFYMLGIHIILSNDIKPFLLKAGESINYKPNDNDINLKLKEFYGQTIMNFQRQHGTLKFTNFHMNAILVETRKAFQISLYPVIINAFEKFKNPNTT